MLHVQQLPSMPSTLLSGYHPHHTTERHHLPQLRDFNWDWDAVRSKAGQSAEQLPRPAGYTSQYVASSTPLKLHENPAHEFILPSGVQYMNPPAIPPPAALLYPTPNIHSRQGSNGRPFYQSYYSARQNQSPPAKRATIREEVPRRRASHDGNAIAPELQIPSTINDSKGSLPELAAQVGLDWMNVNSYEKALIVSSDYLFILV
jgi:hypothetical protein